MTITRKVGLCFAGLLILFNTSLVSARNQNSITLTSSMIRSLESCPASDKGGVGKTLSCSTYRQTTSYTCGPAAVMALMRYYRKLPGSEMNQKTELQIAKEMGAVSAGTTTSQVAGWLSSHGFSVDSGKRVTTDMLIDNINRGMPTLVAFSRHWILAKGYKKGATPEGDKIFFSDSCCGVSVMSRETIDSAWASAQNRSNHCAGNGEYIEAR